MLHPAFFVSTPPPNNWAARRVSIKKQELCKNFHSTAMSQSQHQKPQRSLLHYLSLGPMGSYFLRVFKKNAGGQGASNFNLRMMHGINRISIIMFLFCLMVMLWRCAVR